jgi:sec-independent protein translocase protein TatB
MAEVAVIACVALVVLGPDKLPTVMRQLAKIYRRLSVVREEFSRALSESLGPEAESLKDAAKTTLNTSSAIKSLTKTPSLKELSKLKSELEKPLEVLSEKVIIDSSNDIKPVETSESPTTETTETKETLSS